jgi:hypothetical protein
VSLWKELVKDEDFQVLCVHAMLGKAQEDRELASRNLAYMLKGAVALLQRGCSLSKLSRKPYTKRRVRFQRRNEVMQIYAKGFRRNLDGSITRVSRREVWRELAESNGWTKRQLEAAQRRFRVWRPEVIGRIVRSREENKIFEHRVAYYYYQMELNNNEDHFDIPPDPAVSRLSWTRVYPGESAEQARYYQLELNNNEIDFDIPPPYPLFSWSAWRRVYPGEAHNAPGAQETASEHREGQKTLPDTQRP